MNETTIVGRHELDTAAAKVPASAIAVLDTLDATRVHQDVMTNAIEQEFVAVERECWDSMASKDPAVATRLTGERSLITGAQGVSEVTSAAIGQMVQSDGWALKRYEFSDVKMLTPCADMAILAYYVIEELEVDGKPLTLEANDSTVWMRTRWRGLGAAHRVRGGRPVWAR